MTIDLDLVIRTTEDTVDMKSGLTTMQGVSDTIRCIAEGVLTDKVPERQTPKSNVRTSLKRSFKGSYGHIFSLDVNDADAKKRLRGIGHAPFVELIGYFINEALYREHKELSPKALQVIEKLGDAADRIIQQLRQSPLDGVHDISTKFNHDIVIRHRISRGEQANIAHFDRDSARALKAVASKTSVDLTVSITRLNIHTGNGRLQIKGELETIAFGFANAYKEIAVRFKKIFSSNLDHNNGVASEKWRYVNISAAPITLRDGRVIKYTITGVYNEE